MVNKSVLQSIIDKYYLGENESVKWLIKDKSLSIDFMSSNKSVKGKIIHNNFDLENSELAIFDTKKLYNLVNICSGDLLLELEKTNIVPTKLKISDLNFNLTYALSDPLLISKVGNVNVPEWDAVIELSIEDVNNLIKAKSALSGIDNMLITTTENLDNELVCEFVFGDEQGHNNKITYQIKGNIKSPYIKLPFNSDMFKTILAANKDMEGGVLSFSSMGLLKLEFNLGDVSSEYFLVRKAETSF
jgi:hypothetical protein